MRFNDKIYVAGHNGFIGNSLIRKLNKSNLVTAGHNELDLTDQVKVDEFFQKHRPKYVFLAAGKVGGILLNKKYPSDLINENLAIQLNVLRAAHNADVEKLILFGSSCMYPAMCQMPMNESMVMSARPEVSSLAYAVAKLAGMQMCLAYNEQYGFNRFITVIPNSGYGPHDNFNSETGHVIASLISKFHAAKVDNLKSIQLWGTGSPLREFVHVDDIADACIHLMENETTSLQTPVNIGTGREVSIKTLAQLIARVVDYRGLVSWDDSKPDGAPRKLLDSSRIKSFGWSAKIDLEKGLKDTYDWFVSNDPRCQFP